MADKRKSSIKGLGHDVINALVQKVEKKKKKRESKRDIRGRGMSEVEWGGRNGEEER